MKLVSLQVKNFRSLFQNSSTDSFTVDFTDGMNTIVGPNNCGKSNVCRALAVALDPDFPLSRPVDVPASMPNAVPSIVVTFEVPEKGRPKRESKLLDGLIPYERELNGSENPRNTFAAQGIIKFRVALPSGSKGGQRHESFVAAGNEVKRPKETTKELQELVDLFRDCYRFVMIRSGESLESLLEGRFRQILQSTLRDSGLKNYSNARNSRQEYLDGLQEQLLRPLTQQISSELGDVFPEVGGVVLEPAVPSIEETLTHMRVRVTDAATTDLAEKGTGVRGGLIVAILRHIATEGKRPMVFVVEEPESFLHPAAQEAVRDHMERLAARSDVTLVVASHSPYVVSRELSAQVISLGKAPDGRTIVTGTASGAEPQAAALEGLFRGRVAADLLDRVSHIPHDTRGVIVVEGTTDRDFMEIAVEKAKRPELLEGVVILQAGFGVPGDHPGGAALAVMQAVLAKSITTAPVVALLDDDELGFSAQRTLLKFGDKTGEWTKNKNVLGYRCVMGGERHFHWEAEDLWPDALVKKFVDASDGLGYFNDPLPRVPKTLGIRYDMKGSAKEPFIEFLQLKARAKDCAKWVELLEIINTQFEISSPAPPTDAAGSVDAELKSVGPESRRPANGARTAKKSSTQADRIYEALTHFRGQDVRPKQVAEVTGFDNRSVGNVLWRWSQPDFNDPRYPGVQSLGNGWYRLD